MRVIVRSFAALAALTLVAAGCGSGSNSANPASANGTSAVRAENNQSLGTSVLVNRRGMTLYALSAEKHGRFICTSGDLPGTTTPCVSVWHPLLVGSANSLGTSVAHLGTIQRPGDRSRRSPTTGCRSTRSRTIMRPVTRAATV